MTSQPFLSIVVPSVRGKVWLIGLLSVLFCLTGCSSVRMLRSRIPSPGYRLAQQGYYALVPYSTQYSDVTQVTLQTLNLDKMAREKPANAIFQLQKILERTEQFELTAVIAEIAFQDGKRKEKFDSASAAEMFLQAAEYASGYLFDSRLQGVRNPYDPTFAIICRIYNESTEHLLRLMAFRNTLTIPQEGRLVLKMPESQQVLEVQMKSQDWQLADIKEYLFASDFEVTGFKNRYRVYGLGVPMIAQCQSLAHKSSKYRYCVANYSLPITIFLRLEPGKPPVLEFHDSLEHSEIQIAQQKIPLEIDYTTPLAYCMQSDVHIHRMGTIGLLRPDKLLEKRSDGTREIKGLYMSQPYHAEKMPVVFVHGLWSSPITWMEMYNTLNSIPEIRENYQIWFYFYPNGQPFWVSAAQFRQDLALLRQELDPHRENTQLDRLTLVGHSMGGLISMLQTVNTEEKIWDLVCDVPVTQTSGDKSVQQTMQEWFHFQANPSIECVVTLGTPFRGSAMANSATLGLTEIIGKKATDVEKNIQSFQQTNRSHLKENNLLQHATSIASLQEENPFWNQLFQSEPAPWAHYYNIIGISEKHSRDASQTDGVVTVRNARLPWAQSEIFIHGEHTTIPSNPQAILEVVNILLERLTLPDP